MTKKWNVIQFEARNLRRYAKSGNKDLAMQSKIELKRRGLRVTTKKRNASSPFGNVLKMGNFRWI